LGVRGPKLEIEEKRFVEGAQLTAQKWLDSIEKQRRSNLKFVTDKQTDRGTDRGTDRQTESIADNNRLLGWARRSII